MAECNFGNIKKQKKFLNVIQSIELSEEAYRHLYRRKARKQVPKKVDPMTYKPLYWNQKKIKKII